MFNNASWRTAALVAAGVALRVVAPAAAQPADTVVVVPFANVSAQPTDDWIGVGLAETVAADLRSAGIAVVGHRPDAGPDPLLAGNGNGNGNGNGYESTNGNGDGYRWAPGDALDVHRRRGVTWLVDGTIQRLGNRLRITTRLVEVATGAIAFSNRVDGMLGDLFDIQDALGASLAARLSTDVEMAAAPAARRPQRNVVASPTLARDPTAGLDAGPERNSAAPPSRPAFDSAATESRSERNVTGALAFGGSGGSGTAPAQRRPRRPGGGGFTPTPRERPTVVIGRSSNPPAIDGRLDDSVWETATYINDFIQIAPVEGAPGTEETEVWMAYDNDHLYFAFYAHYTRPEVMRINRADREEIRGDDRMAVLFDTFLDQQRAYQFEVNGYTNGADGKKGTADDVKLGRVAPVSWKLEEYVKRINDDDIKFVGTLDQAGLFTPALDGPNPERDMLEGNVGDVWVEAWYQPPGAKRAMGARAHLLVMPPRFVFPPIE